MLLELGFALEALGDRKSLIVMNQFYGSPDELPFDLGHRRWPITYTLAPKSSKQVLQAARSDLQSRFVDALRTLLTEPSPDAEEVVVATTQVEIAYDVADGPHSIILDQVTNGVAVRMALLYLVTGGKRHADGD